MEIEVIDLENFDHAPSPRYGHTATLVESILYVFGGVDAEPSRPDHAKFFNTMYTFDVENMVWSTDVAIDEVTNFGRHYHTTVYNPSDGFLYIFGGKANGYRNDLIRYDRISASFELIEGMSSSEEEIGNVPSPRWGHSCVIRSPTAQHNQKGVCSMLLFGGYDSNGFVHNSLYEFVFETRQWTKLGNIDGLQSVPRRYLHSAAVISIKRRSETEEEDSTSSCLRRYVIVGGLKRNKMALSDIWSLDLDNLTGIQPVEIQTTEETDVISSLTTTDGQRLFVLGNDTLYLYGGRSSSQEDRGSDIESCLKFQFDGLASGSLTVVDFPFSSTPLAYCSVNTVGNSKVLFFGGQRTPKGGVQLVPSLSDRPLPVVFGKSQNNAANLLHFLPDELLMSILEYMDRNTLCCVRAVSSRWSPSLLSSHDSLWKKFFEEVSTKVENPFVSMYPYPPKNHSPRFDEYFLREIDSAVSFKEKASCVLRVEFERKHPTNRLKIVLVGDGAVGRTCLLSRYAKGTFPRDYVPTQMEITEAIVLFEDRPVNLFAIDPTDDGLRPLSYPETNVFLICFSLVDPSSLQNVKAKWYPELMEHAPNTPIILVGTKLDLRDDPEIIRELAERDEKAVTTKEAQLVAGECQLNGFVETSSKTGVGVDEAFDVAIRAVVAPSESRKPKKKCALM